MIRVKLIKKQIEDLLKKELEEINIINEFLPKQMDENETKNLSKCYKNYRSLVYERYGKDNGHIKKRSW